MYLSTTGNVDNVVIRDMGGVLFTHPISLSDVSFFNIDKLSESNINEIDSLAYHIENDNIKLYDKDYTPLSATDLAYVEENKTINTVSSDLNKHIAVITEQTGWEFGNITDYYKLRQLLEIKVLSEEWSDLTSNQKNIATEYNVHTIDADKITHLMTNGKTLEESRAYLLDKWHENHIRTVPCCNTRFQYAKKVFMGRLSVESISDFCNNKVSLINNFIHNAILGLEYHDVDFGIMDFVESTNKYSGDGMQENYTLKTAGDTWDSIKQAIKDVLVNGNYTEID